MTIIELFVKLLPENFRLAVYIPASILMAVFYIMSGVYLKNESFHKVALLTQIMAYIGHMTHNLFARAGIYIPALAGGSGIWNFTLSRLLQKNNVVNSIAYIFMVFVAPFLIAVGMKIAGKSFKINVKKECLSAICVAVLFFIINSVYPIAESFIEKTGEPVEVVKAGAAIFAILLLSITGGIVLRKIKLSKICFIMVNLSLLGITFSFFFNSFFLRAFNGAEMMFDLFFKIAFNKNSVMMLFIPCLFVLLGAFIGGKTKQ